MVCKTLDIQSYIASRSELINGELDLLTSLPGTSKTLYEAARYSLFSGGKRLRPLLAIATAEALGCPPEIAQRPACALELIHTYSMIHDDLPCMDDDDFRRGKPTLHKVYPEGTAVLAGDFLLTLAFETLAQSPKLSADQRIHLIAQLAQAAGGHGMVAGQQLDIETEGQQLTLEELNIIHKGKTGALISAAFQFGGIIASASHDVLANLTQIGQLLGLAFQIIDDVLDVEKGYGSDVANAKTTYATLRGVATSKEDAQRLLQQSCALIDALPGDSATLRALAEKLVNRMN